MATDNRVEKEETDLNEEYSVFLKHLKAEKEESSRFAKTMFFIVIFFCAIVLLLLIASEYKSDIIKTFGENSFATKMLLIFPANIKNKQKVKFTMPFLPRRQNILLCGVDANGSTRDPWTGARTDTIIVLNVDPASKSVNAISIPRDSKVYLPGDFGIQKINSAHAIGGINMTIKTIEQTLGIKIDHYVMVHDNAVEHIVDTLGGIPIYVEKNMYYNDYSGDLHINLSKGLNILSGKNAVGYLRFRKDGLGDIGRTRRQQWFIKGLLEKIQQPQTIAKIPELVQTVSQYVKTDMSIYEISQYASMTKSFDANKIEFATLPGAPNKHGYISYWILDPEKTQEMINRMIYRENFASDKDYNIGIRYSDENSYEADELKNNLENAGFNVNCFGQSKLPHSQFIAHDSSVSADLFNKLKESAPLLNKMQFVYNPDKVFCTSSDITIYIAGE